MKQQRVYKYRFYPTPTQAQTLARTFGCARYVYTNVLICQEALPCLPFLDVSRIAGHAKPPL